MSFLAWIGLFGLVHTAVKLAALAYRILCPTKIDISKYGPWALITGCTDGIGRAYTFELAKRGRICF